MASSERTPAGMGVGRPGAELVPGYRLIERVGAGGAGEVWCAEGPGGLPVALKLVRLACKLGGRELDNLRILRAVRHPNLLAYFGAWTTDDLLIIGMELAECSLWDRFNRLLTEHLAGIPFSELLAIMGEVARVIDFLNEPRHELDGKTEVAIHHRDIKPQNIMLLGGGVKVADFGLSCLHDQYATSRSHDGLTYPYAAPETFRRHVSEHSDQYSLAVTYCVLRGGRLPFVGPPANVMLGHLFEPPDLSMLPEPEQPVVQRALAKIAAERWPDCRQFIETLASCTEAGSPETIPASDNDQNGDATSRYQEPVLSRDRSSQIPTGFLIDSSAEDVQSSYRLGSSASTPVASSMSSQSRMPAAVVAADRAGGAQPWTRATLLRGAIGSLIILAVGSCATLVPGVSARRLPAIRFNGQLIPLDTIDRAHPPAQAAGTIHSPVLSPLVAYSPLDPSFAALGTRLHASACDRSIDEPPPALDESATGAKLEPRPRPRPDGQSRSGSLELKARSLRLIHSAATALGRLRLQAAWAIQVARAAIAQPAPKPPRPMPIQAAAVPRVPQRRQENEETLRIVVPDTIEIHAGWSKQVPVSAYRNGLDGPVSVQFDGVPAGVSLPPVIMPSRFNRTAASLRAEIEVRSVQVNLRVTACCGPRQSERSITLIVHANPSLAYRYQGYRLLASGQPAEAIGAFSRALEIAAGDPIVLNNRGVAHAQLGHLDSAVADYSAAIRLSPGDAVARYNRAVAFARQRNMTRALLDLDTAIRLKPNYAPAYRSRAQLYERSGNAARAAADRMKADQITHAQNPQPSPTPVATATTEFPSFNAPDLSLTSVERAGSF
jgi:serine/threonine protein kinase/Tfp pilus assembly protein PilF